MSVPQLKILISYRREDSAGYAGRLYDDLSERIGEGQVFIDIDAIEPGVDFTEVIAHEIGSADVVLVVMGRRWLDIEDGRGRRRLDDAGDYHRLEIEAALERNIRVIPLLVQDATMPHRDELPESIQRLAHRNALQLSDQRWRYDLGQLADALDRIARAKAPPEPEPLSPPEHASDAQAEPVPSRDSESNPRLDVPAPAFPPPPRPDAVVPTSETPPSPASAGASRKPLIPRLMVVAASGFLFLPSFTSFYAEDGIPLMILGFAALITGIVLLTLPRPRRWMWFAPLAIWAGALTFDLLKVTNGDIDEISNAGAMHFSLALLFIGGWWGWFAARRRA